MIAETSAGPTRQRVVVLGGGIAGLTAAYRLQQRGDADVTLVEADDRLGGKVQTERQEGFVLEGGPDAFIPHKPQALELVRELGLDGRLLASNDGRRGLFIRQRAGLHPVPDGLPMLVPSSWRQMAVSPLLSWRGKMRLAAERWASATPSEGDESVADFVRRRFGSEVLERVAEPILAHIHAGDVERMSLLATYPRLAALERRWGSLHRGVQAMRAKTKSAKTVPAGSKGPPGPLFWTLRGGLAEMIEGLAAALEPDSTILGHRAVSLQHGETSESLYAVELDDGRRLEADAVILAVPPFAAADLLETLDADLAARLREIRFVTMGTLSLAYRRADFHRPLDGFGFFVPRRHIRHVLACTWTSTKFDHRAPEDTVLLRIFLGGALQHDLLDLDDETLIRGVEDDLQEIMGFRATPILRHLTRWPDGYPQYDVGHHQRVERIETEMPVGMVLAGSGYHGVGLPDCIRSGSEAAARVGISEAAKG